MEEEVKKRAKQLEEALNEFDFVLFSMCDVHGIPKGKLVPREMLAQACRDGVGIFSGTQYMGCNSETLPQVKAFQNFPNGTMRPLEDTVRPLMWSSSPQRRIGQVLCQMEIGEGDVFEECPRLVAQRQVERLRLSGMMIKSAFECEFNVLKGDSLEPLGGNPAVPYANLDVLDQHMDLFADMLNVLRSSGIRLEYLFPEYQAGQYEVTMQPQWGVGSADDAFAFRHGVRSFCHRQGLKASFMPLPFAHYWAAGLHFNHSLWSSDGRNLLHDPTDPLKLTPVARHWIAGLLEHGPALTALSAPTHNCYRRVGVGFSPGFFYWNVDDRLSAFRAKTTGGNVYLENRVPSAAGNPYLVLAATIAAGLDGVKKQLACPKPGRPEKEQAAVQIPRTLQEALDALEKDEVLKEALGGKTVEYFLTLKRDIDVKHFQEVTAKIMSKEEQLAKEREYYMAVM